jgi:hypothetical protein
MNPGEEVQAVPAPADVSWLSKARRHWDKIASVLAIIGLCDLTSQLVKWVAGIHWVVSHYAVAKAWVFSWAPFHIPPEWHDVIVLFLILFSVTNIGFYQRIGRSYTGELARSLGGFVLIFILLLPAVFSRRLRKISDGIAERFTQYYTRPVRILANVLVVLPLAIFFIGAYLESVRVMQFGVISAGVITVAVAAGALVAWRWILGTFATFAALVAVNEIYVRFLERLTGSN